MKAKIIIAAVLLMINIQVFAQNYSHRMNKRATEIELYDIAGQKYTGFLWFANPFKVIMFDSKTYSLISIKRESIYQIHLHKKWGFGRMFGYVSAMAATVVLVAVVPSDNQRVAKSDVVLGATTLLGIVGGAAIASYIQNNDKLNLNYIINGSLENYKKILPVLQKYMRMKTYKRVGRFYDYKNIVELTPQKNTHKTNKIEIPKKNENPFSENIYHVSANFGVSFNNLTSEFETKLKSKDFHSSTYFFFPEIENKSTSYQFDFKYNILPKFRFYANYSTSTETNIILVSEFDDEILYRNKINSMSSGFSFVFNPINYSMINDMEFSLSAGLAYNFLNCEYTFARGVVNNEKKYYKNYSNNADIFGLQLAGNLNFYLSKHFSLKLNLQAEIMLPTIIGAVTEKSKSGEIVTTNDIQIKLFTMRQVFGLSYHF